MDHKRVYDNLMRTRQNLMRKKSNDGSLERHHILPRCMGGKNTKENLVLLTPREHFVAHLLLVHIATGKQKSMLSYALHMMTRNNPNQDRIVTARQYADAKSAMQENCTGVNHPVYGHHRTAEFKAAMSKRMQGPGNHRYGLAPWNQGLTSETSDVLKRSGEKLAQTLRDNPSLLEGRCHSAATRQKMSEAAKGKPKSKAHRESLSKSLMGHRPTDEAVEKRAAALRGRPQKMVSCPHCGVEGGVSVMAKWHFNNCAQVKQRVAVPHPKNSQKVTCPHCGKSGGQSAMYRWHFNNCKEQNCQSSK